MHGYRNTAITLTDAVTRGSSFNSNGALWVTTPRHLVDPGCLGVQTTDVGDAQPTSTHLAQTPLALPATSTGTKVWRSIRRQPKLIAPQLSGPSPYSSTEFLQELEQQPVVCKARQPVEGTMAKPVATPSGVRRRAAAGTEPRPGGAIDERDITSNYLEALSWRLNHQRPDRPDRLFDCPHGTDLDPLHQGTHSAATQTSFASLSPISNCWPVRRQRS